MPQNEQGLECASAREETKLEIRDLVVLNTPILDDGAQDICVKSVQGATHSNHSVVAWVDHWTLLSKEE